METVFRISNCTVENQVKFATCTLMGIALTWWNSHARTVTNEVAYAMTWTDLKKKMTTKYCPRNEIKKIEAEMWNLKVQGTRCGSLQTFPELALLVTGGLPKRLTKLKDMSEAIEMATELMDRRNNTFAERQAENKRKFEDTPRYNQNTTKPKGRTQAGSYAAGRSRPATANNNNNNRNNNNNNNRNNNNNNNRNNNNPRAQGANTNAIVCFECGAPSYFRKEFPQWKNKNQGNGNAVARAYAVGVAGQNPDNNVVTEMGTYDVIIGWMVDEISSVIGSMPEVSDTGCQSFWHHYYVKEIGEQVEEEQTKDVPIANKISRSISRGLLGLPQNRQVEFHIVLESPGACTCSTGTLSIGPLK
ncbi:reverse transcriptase domain-containing protein [Tanacetum coccineum]